MHELIEDQAAEEAAAEKDARWEALRLDVNTFGARAALDRAMGFKGGNVLMEYLWFLLVVIALILGLRFMGSVDSECRKLEPTPPAHAPANMR